MNYFLKALSITVPCVLLWVFSPLSYASSQSLDRDTYRQCQQVKKSTEKYQLRRRKGGSVKAMDSWKREINDLDDVFTKLRCNRYRGKL